ncbi:MAG: type II toxin-antitoxin system VapC family toxin [Anaerolineae bacterium]
MKIYLDTSVYKRPFDDQAQPRIWLETLAFSVILQAIEASEVDLVTSSVVAYENSQDPQHLRRQWATKCMSLATEHQVVAPAIRERAEALATLGLTSLDALHLASAEAAACDYLLTCDDRLLKRSASLSEVAVCNPVDFVVDMMGDME